MPLTAAQAASNAAMTQSGNYTFANGSGTRNGTNYGAGSFNPNTGALALTGQQNLAGVQAGMQGMQPNPPGQSQSTPQQSSIQFGGKSYDLSTADGLKAYQTDFSKSTKPQLPAGQNNTPMVGSPALQTTQNNPLQNPVTPTSASQTGEPFKQAFTQLSQGNTAAPQIPSEGRAAVSQATNQYQPPAQAYQPTQQFMQYGDPIMNTFVNAAMAYQQDVIDTGYTAKAMQAGFANQMQGMDLEAANLQNIMLGTRDDIRAEINKAGGFATESQVEGLVTTRNRDLLKQYNNLELRKQTMQNQLQLQVGIAQADHQYAVDKFDNLTKTASLYKGIYDNATNQVDKLVQNVGYSGMAAAYNYDPRTLAMVEQHLNMPTGTLSDPRSLASLDTYRNRSLALSASRFIANYGYNPGGNTSGTPTGAPTPNGGSGTTGGTSNFGATYGQYGLLANTDFNPSSPTDKNAQNYLTTYLNGKLPQNGSDIGITVRGAVGSSQYQAAVTRANNLYYAATGQNLPSPEIIESNLGLISANNKLANNLKIQEGTVERNFGLSLQNINANNLNQAWPILNNVINGIKNAEGDPAVAQYMAQNSTIQQELGNLLAVKNASGTTVYDKIAGAGLLPKNATPAQQIQIVKTLLQEAKNASTVFNQVNGDLYRQVDPLERQANNPNRYSTTKAGKPFNYLNAKNAGYTDKEIEDYITSH